MILGRKLVTRTLGRGDFFCPECETRRPYSHQRVQARFAVFYVSVLPLDELGEYLECGACRGTFRTAVLDHQGERRPDRDHIRRRFEAEFRPAVLRIMILMMMVDGRIDAREKRMIIDVNERLTGRTLSLEAIDEHSDAVRLAGRSALDYATSVAPLLNEPGKELVLKAAFSVAVADGRVQEVERTLMHRLGRALGMSAGHVRAVLAESTAAATELLPGRADRETR
jgi:tellurite resistance protein